MLIDTLINTIAVNPPAEVQALIKLIDVVLQEDKYKQLVREELKDLPNFHERKNLLEAGHFSGLDLSQLLLACGAKNGVNTTVISSLVNQLVNWMLISDNQIAFPNGLVRFLWNKNRIVPFRALAILDNLLLGPSYVAQKYRQSVPPIFVKKGDDEFTGTGFLTTNQANASEFVIVTAKHNVNPADGIVSVSLGPVAGATYTALASDWILHPSLDLAAMPVKCNNAPVPIHPVGGARVLARTITLGYPRIATTAESYLFAQGGELNALVDTFHKESYLIISNAVAPGNSGGPVLDEVGLCLGMVVRSFETRHEGGVSVANAALPAVEILNFVSSVL